MSKASDISDLDILALIDAHYRNYSLPFAYEVLIARGFPEKVVYAKYDKLYRRGFLDCGVSIRTGWLSPKGLRELERLQSLESSSPSAPSR